MKKLFFLWILTLFIYLFFAGRGKFDFPTTARNYFSLQAYSILKGHLDLIVLPKDNLDLSFYQGKAYFYWPPLSSLFVLPFVFLYGVNVSDVFYTAFWSSFSAPLIYLILKKAKQLKIIPILSEKYIVLLTLFFAFGTVQFYLSVVGTVWFTAQTITLFVLLLSIYFLLISMEKKSIKYFLISFIIFNFSVWGRNMTILYIPLFLYIFNKIKLENRSSYIYISLILFLNVLFFGLYNLYRFGNIFNLGYSLHNYNPKLAEDVKNLGFYNLKYVPRNFFYLFISPLNFKFNFPYILPDPSGNSIFSTSPLFLLLLGIFSINFKKYKHLFVIIICLIVNIFILMIFFSTGWFQFGHRYVLDIIPLLILLLAWVLPLYPKSFVYFLFILSVIINTLGTVWMLMLAPKLYY